MATFLFTFAVPEEARPFRRRLPPQKAPHILFTGIGPRKASAALSEALPHLQPDVVLTCGFAGGLHPDLRAGTIVADLTDAGIFARLLHPLQLPHARFHTSTRVATCAEDKRALHAATGADAVEMESGPIRDLCRQRGIPCAIIRVISDAAHEDLPLDFNRFLDADGNLSIARILAAIAGAPGRIPALLRFQQQTRLAAERLAEVLARVLAAIVHPG